MVDMNTHVILQEFTNKPRKAHEHVTLLTPHVNLEYEHG